MDISNLISIGKKWPQRFGQNLNLKIPAKEIPTATKVKIFLEGQTNKKIFNVFALMNFKKDGDIFNFVAISEYL